MSQGKHTKSSTLELANLIEKGMSHITENRACFISYSSKSCGCALGMAFVEKVGDVEKALDMYRAKAGSGNTLSAIMSELLNMPRELVLNVNNAHQNGGISAKGIINLLRTGEFDEYAQA